MVHPSVMTAQLIDGKAIAASLRQQIASTWPSAASKTCVLPAWPSISGRQRPGLPGVCRPQAQGLRGGRLDSRAYDLEAETTQEATIWS